MRVRRRALAHTTTAAVLAFTVVISDATPAAAHGLDGPRNLPLPRWLFVAGAGLTVGVSFVFAKLLWRRPRLTRLDSLAVALLPRHSTVVLGRIGHALGVLLYVAVLALALFGDMSINYNAAPRTVLVLFWVALPLASALIGDVWGLLNPFPTIVSFSRRLATVAPRSAPPPWTAAATLFGFVWLELAHPDPSNPRVIGGWILTYSLLVFMCARQWGPRWLAEGEGFATLFGAIATLSPIGRAADGRLALRPPLAALVRTQRPQVLGVVLLALGAATFDGISQLDWWKQTARRRSDIAYSLWNTAGILVGVALVAVVYLGASWIIARATHNTCLHVAVTLTPSLVPIAAGYTLAHYWSLLVFDGQIGLSQLSDPLGRGWNLFGTRGSQLVDFRILRSSTSSYVQAGALIAGHIGGVVVAHDLTLARWPGFTICRTELPMLIAMLTFTVAGFALLLGG